MLLIVKDKTPTNSPRPERPEPRDLHVLLHEADRDLVVAAAELSIAALRLAKAVGARAGARAGAGRE